MDRLSLLLQADELADMILQLPEVQSYRETEAAMERNTDAMNLLRRFRELREQVAEFQARRVPPMHYASLLQETDELMAKLEEIPEVQAFEAAQERMNELFDAITARLKSAVETQINEDSASEDL